MGQTPTGEGTIGAPVSSSVLRPETIARHRRRYIGTGRLVNTDGPFAETKEQLRGYYDLEAPDLDHVTELIDCLWELEHGTVEIRPVLPSPGQR